MLRKILVAVDNSLGIEQVMDTVGELQLQPTTKAILCHAIAPPDLNGDLAADKPQSRSFELPYRQIEKHLQAYQKQLPCESELEIVSGDPAEEIVRLANIHNVDLIVIGSRGLTGMKRIVLGSVSSQVVADAQCSVLVVKPR